jgi:iron complex outermembrane receptor protein
MKQSKAFSYAVAFLLPCTVALAQDQKSGAGSQGATGKQPDLFNMALEDVLNMDVSTASKLHVKGTQSPGNLVVVTQDQIRRYGYRTVGEALERVPGFLNSKLGAFAFIGYRGLSPQSVTGNSRILVMIDGVRYNEWNFDQASLNERFPLDIESVDRIEVLKGAGSAIRAAIVQNKSW